MGMLGKTATARHGSYAEKKTRERDRNAAASAADRDIAPGEPGVGNRRRRARCHASLQAFLRTYFPAAFPLPFCATTSAYRQTGAGFSPWRIVRRGHAARIGKDDDRSPRRPLGALYGFRRFACLVGATDSAARSLLATIKAELVFNELLATDFREVCYPIRCLKNNARLCTGQLWDGKQTLITWSADRVVFPTIPKSKVSGELSV